MKTEVDVFFPRVHLEGLYKGEGRFNDFKMNSKGYFNVTMSECLAQKGALILLLFASKI